MSGIYRLCVSTRITQDIFEKTVKGMHKVGNIRNLYLDLMKRCLTDLIYMDRSEPTAIETREKGQDWPRSAHTMIGLKRLNNIQFCLENVLAGNIPGDIIETGVWRGGATIFMRAILKAYDIRDRIVWVADSFEGLPRPNREKYPQDANSTLYTFDYLTVPIEEVKADFESYGLLDDQVRFLKGWFKDTLPHAPIEKLALIRLDGDLYESTMDALTHLYPKLSVGGYLIVDDFGAVPGCQEAVEDYRRQYCIGEDIVKIDWTGIYWRRI